jgi:heat shock protein HtpX
MSARNAQFLFVMTLLFVVVGALLDRFVARGSRYFAFSFLIVSLAMNGFFYFFSDKIILLKSGAKRLSPSRAPKIHSIVERIARKARIPKPALFWIDSPEPNAFATGRDERHAAVAVTLGLIRTLDERQMEGVLAHEIAHIKNQDTMAASILAAMAGTLAYLGRALLPFSARGAGFGQFIRGFRLILFAALIGLAAPFLALVIKFAASRSREFAADEDAADFTGGPEALASALKRMESCQDTGNGSLAPGMRLLTTFSPKAASTLTALLRTHPPVEARLKRLRGRDTK